MYRMMCGRLPRHIFHALRPSQEAYDQRLAGPFGIEALICAESLVLQDILQFHRVSMKH